MYSINSFKIVNNYTTIKVCTVNKLSAWNDKKQILREITKIRGNYYD